jgi:predicted phage-related endonuclease
MLNAAQMKARDGKLTASRVACLMTGDNDKILNLWRELVGDPAYVEEDLSNVWAVQLGTATEELNLDWFERRTGKKVTRRGEVVIHPECDWAACTLDGWIDD